ncbi:hypothetical protein ISCGN_008454 [Ixodes scapularis]
MPGKSEWPEPFRGPISVKTVSVIRTFAALSSNKDPGDEEHRRRESRIVRKALYWRLATLVLSLCGVVYQASQIIGEYLDYRSAVDLRIEGSGTLLYPGLSYCLTNWINKEKLCSRYPQFCNFSDAMLPTLRKILEEDGYLTEIATDGNSMTQAGIVNSPNYFIDFYLENRSIEQSFSRLPKFMCYTLSWRKYKSMEYVHQNPLYFELNLLVTWIQESVVEMDPYELDLGLHHVDTSSAGQKHALVLQPSGYYTLTFQQRGVKGLPHPYDTKCTNYSQFDPLAIYPVKMTRQICLEECQMNITRNICQCIDQGYTFRNRLNDSGCTAQEMESCVLPRSRPVALVECEKLCGFPCEETIYDITQSFSKTYGLMAEEGVYFLKLKLLMTSRNVEVVHFIPAITLTELLGIVGGYMGFWMELSTLKVLWRLVGVAQRCLASGRLLRGRPLALLRARFAWSLGLVVAAGGCAFVCLVSSYWDVRSYLQYRTTVLFEQTSLSGIAFPEMTVCNENGVNITKLCLDAGRPECSNASFAYAIGTNMELMKHLLHYSYPIDFMVDSCQMAFAGETCESFSCTHMWRLSYTSNWKAICFTLRLASEKDDNSSRAYRSCREPWKYKLELRLAVQKERAEEEEEVAPLSALLHEQDLFTAGMLNPFIFTYGEKYVVSVFQHEVLSLPPPYETMCSQYGQKGGEYSYADGIVQSEECSSKCIADNWQKHCNCFSKLYSVKHRRKGPICEYIDHLRCTDKMKKQLWLHSCQSACTRPCREVRYRGLVFRTGLLPQASASDNRSQVHVTVVMGSNKKKTIYTFPRLPLEDLAIYIGGHVDMWLGFALIGVLWVALDLAIRCSKWCHG